MHNTNSLSNKITFFIIVLAVFFTQYTVDTFSLDSPVEIAQGGSKSSGNEMLKAIEGGTELKGMTKVEITASYGEPWQKDTNGEKGRYDEKWIYSCETHNGLTYDCVFLYFMADRVVNVENF